jgi:hypothetical protein
VTAKTIAAGLIFSLGEWKAVSGKDQGVGERRSADSFSQRL